MVDNRKKPSSVSDIINEMRSAADALRPVDINAEIRKATESLRVMNPREEYDKLLEAIRPRNFANEIRRATVQPYLAIDEWRRAQESLARPTRTLLESADEWRRTIESVRRPPPTLADMATEWRRNLEWLSNNPVNEATKLTRFTAVSAASLLVHAAGQLAAEPTDVTALLATSLATYTALFGKYRPPAARAPTVTETAARMGSDNAAAGETNATRTIESEVDAITLEVTNELESAADRKQISLLSLEFFLSTLIAVLILIYQNKLSNDSERRLTERVAAVEATLLGRVATLEVTEDRRPLVYAVRMIDLRQATRTRANITATWYPNVPGRIVEERNHWVRVEYYDQAKHLHRSGWCKKKWIIRK